MHSMQAPVDKAEMLILSYVMRLLRPVGQVVFMTQKSWVGKSQINSRGLDAPAHILRVKPSLQLRLLMLL
jgi:hypothetical protein